MPFHARTFARSHASKKDPARGRTAYCGCLPKGRETVFHGQYDITVITIIIIISERADA
jgi:hypothetical protein